jgi:tRNA A-37 threonylcarbamoyl transferase component Bud32
MDTKTGWLQKLPSSGKRRSWLPKQNNWKTRFFVLMDTSLVWSTGEEGSTRRGEMRLTKDTKVRHTDDKLSSTFTFQVTSGSTLLDLAADSEEERRLWTEAIAARLKIIEEIGARKLKAACRSRFALLQVLGRGGFGKITLVERTRDAMRFAMKTLDKSEVSRHRMRGRVELERQVMEDLSHPFLVHCHYAFETPSKLYMIMDYLQGGDLLHWLTAEDRFPESRAMQYSAEVLLALEHLHSLGLAHRDLKAENVVLDTRGHAKLIDFGLMKKNCSMYAGAKTLCGTVRTFSHLTPRHICAV